MNQNQHLILIADDDEDDQQLLQEVLHHIDPHAAMIGLQGGRDLLQYLVNNKAGDRPSLLILDYNMPDMNAIEVLQQLATDRVLEKLPVVVWSTSNLEKTARLCVEKGAKAYFIKPIELGEATLMAERMLKYCQ